MRRQFTEARPTYLTSSFFVQARKAGAAKAAMQGGTMIPVDADFGIFTTSSMQHCRALPGNLASLFQSIPVPALQQEPLVHGLFLAHGIAEAQQVWTTCLQTALCLALIYSISLLLVVTGMMWQQVLLF